MLFVILGIALMGTIKRALKKKDLQNLQQQRKGLIDLNRLFIPAMHSDRCVSGKLLNQTDL